MTGHENIASAMLILGSIYFGYTHGFEWWHTTIIVLGFVSWGYLRISDEGKELLKAQARYYEAKTDYYNVLRRDVTERIR